MGRQLRMVAKNWKHPKNKDGYYIPLYYGNFKKLLSDYNEGERQWNKGFRRDWDNRDQWIEKEKKYSKMSYQKWDGERPIKDEYMPQWSKKEKTHIQLYENTTEGTPISPVFKLNDIEKLAEYAAKKCTTFADFKASKEYWLELIKDDLINL